MNKRQLNALERVFTAEISGLLPFQSRAKLFRELCESGHLETMTVVIRGAVVRGYSLTHRGRIAYCETCREDEE